jgi:hypothetical protein
MSHKPILTSASLYGQGAAVPARRLVAAGIKRGPAGWLVEQPEQSPAASYVRRQQAMVHADAAASLYDELAAEAREAGDFAEAAECEAYAAGIRGRLLPGVA